MTPYVIANASQLRLYRQTGLGHPEVSHERRCFERLYYFNIGRKDKLIAGAARVWASTFVP